MDADVPDAMKSQLSGAVNSEFLCFVSHRSRIVAFDDVVTFILRRKLLLRVN